MPDWILSKISGTLNVLRKGVCVKSGAEGAGNGGNEKGGDGVLIHVEDPDAVTPVARDTLDSAQMVLSSSSW